MSFRIHVLSNCIKVANRRFLCRCRLDDLMKLWMEFQATTKDSSTKIQKLESTLKTVGSLPGLVKTYKV